MSKQPIGIRPLVSQKVIIVQGMNIPPEDDVNQRLEELGSGWRVVSATTAMCPFGQMDINQPGQNYRGVCRHMYYTVTVVVERK